MIGEGWEQLATSEDQLHLAIGAAAQAAGPRSQARKRSQSCWPRCEPAAGVDASCSLLIDADALTAAVPLWIGTLGDIEDLLPARAGSFDLVILDEAAHIDQPSAAPALLRSRRAVVVGDPRQLRHVSFLADAAIDLAMAATASPSSLRSSTCDATPCSTGPPRWHRSSTSPSTTGRSPTSCRSRSPSSTGTGSTS
ncbi:MAG: AAA domain-containing protein [Acidimicrobiales bacterium]